MDNQDKKKEEDVHKNIFVPNSKYFTIVIYGLLFVLGALLIYIFVGHFSITLQLLSKAEKILSPFLTGAFIAFILYPLVKFFYKKVFMGKMKWGNKLSKVLAILITYLLAVGVFIILLVFIIPQIYESIVELTNQIPTWYNRVHKFIIQFEESHKDIPFLDYEVINNKINSAMPSIMNNITSIAGNLLSKVFTTSITIIKGIFNFIIAIMVSVYMLSDNKIIFYNFKRFMYSFIPVKTADKMREIFRESANIFSSFIIGKVIDSLIIGIIAFVILCIFRFPYAVLLSVIIGITNIIPYFGPYMGAFIGSIILVFINPFKVPVYIILVLIIQQFDGLYLGPKILGEKTGLRPLWVIFAIMVGGSLFGVIGMFLGVPCVAVISYIINRAVEHSLRKKNIKVKPYDNSDIL